MNRPQAPQPVVRPIQPGDKLSHYSGMFDVMPTDTWFVFEGSVKVGEEYGGLVVRRSSLGDDVEVAGSVDDRNTFLVVKGVFNGDEYTVTSLSEEFTDEVSEYDQYLSDLARAWGGERYNVINELQPHVEQWFEM